ncbi:MAG TPA: SDR family oxidoreductase [Solirubrobacteraceae bacterium]|nr:SDR family oxidoreductase [Solirubrobacteraceae bacterium]
MSLPETVDAKRGSARIALLEQEKALRRRENFEAEVLSPVPLGRVGTPDEAAAVALFLRSDAAAYVAAGQYAVDDGLTKR